MFYDIKFQKGYLQKSHFMLEYDCAKTKGFAWQITLNSKLVKIVLHFQMVLLQSVMKHPVGALRNGRCPTLGENKKGKA